MLKIKSSMTVSDGQLVKLMTAKHLMENLPSSLSLALTALLTCNSSLCSEDLAVPEDVESWLLLRLNSLGFVQPLKEPSHGNWLEISPFLAGLCPAGVRGPPGRRRGITPLPGEGLLLPPDPAPGAPSIQQHSNTGLAKTPGETAPQLPTCCRMM